jgi:hypothetical protein
VRQFGKKAKGLVQRGRRRILACNRLLVFVSGHLSEFQQAAVGKLPQ